MGHSDFGTELAAVRRRLSDLQRQSAEGSHQVVRLLPEVFEQLQAELEELRIATEDLCKENEERTADLTAANKRLQEEIAERKHAEEELKESEEQFREIAENVDEVFFLSDARDQSAIYINPAYEKIWGRSVEEIYANAESWQEAIHPEDRARACAVIERHGRGQREFSNEYRIVRPDGAIRWVHDRVYPITNESGQVYRIIGVAADITERRRAEELARQRQAELAHVSRVNTMGEMASGIAHELNQPLTAIVNYTNGCLRQLRSGATDADELVSAIERIAGQAERAGEIIRQLGYLVRRREPERSLVDINDAVQEVLRLMQPDAGQHGITVRVNLSEGLSPVLADNVQIQQVILNLVRNGIEAMETSDPSRRMLTVETSATDDDAVEVTVRDTGHGFTDEVVDKLFDPFFTIKPHGMGVGLSISRTIIDAHGGRLWATRNADRGATFTFTLPGASGGDDHAS